MRDDFRRRRDAHVRANGVCTEHSPFFDATEGGRKTRTSLDTIVADEDRQLTIQKQCIEDRLASTEKLRLARLVLHDSAKAIVGIGRFLSLDEPFTATLTLPPRSASDSDLMAYSRGLLERVAPHAGAFEAQGLPADALAKFAGEIERFAAAKDLQASARLRFAETNRAIRASQRQAGKTIDALEAIALSRSAEQPEVLTKLRAAKRIGPRALEEEDQASPPADKVA